MIVPCVVRTRSRSLNRSKTRTVVAGGRGVVRERESRQAERVQMEQRKNEAIALKETEADPVAPLALACLKKSIDFIKS